MEQLSVQSDTIHMEFMLNAIFLLKSLNILKLKPRVLI